MRPTARTLLALLLLTGCAAEPAAPVDLAAPSQDRHRQMEAAIGDCMKQRGFKYVNMPSSGQKTDEETRQEAGDYGAMRKHREKYGFGVYSKYVYPEDAKAGGMTSANQDPNNPIMMALSPVQLESWRAARDTCYAAATGKFTGKTVSSESDLYEQVDTMIDQAQARELDGDARLLDLAGRFGDCLTAKGVKIGSLKPTDIASTGKKTVQDEMYALGEKQQAGRGADTAELRKALARRHGGSSGKVRFTPSLSPDEARPYLAREVKAALDDLECGRDFYAAFKPRQQEIHDRVYREFGRDDGPAS
ncbi:hypothetical protein [Streptosporangium canum]|uniref:hypothetical protein n=1 Tax=Streptosporangium canum TaxID=324952 RepID=UPI00344093E0